MNDTRPVNLDMTKMQLPVTGVASILHRICAVIIWFGFGFMLWALSIITGSPEGYARFAALLADNFFIQFVSWGFLTALGYYCTGTIKHIIQDFGYFEDFPGGKMISWTAISLGIVLSILSGVVIWA